MNLKQIKHHCECECGHGRVSWLTGCNLHLAPPTINNWYICINLGLTGRTKDYTYIKTKEFFGSKSVLGPSPLHTYESKRIAHRAKKY